MRQKNKVVDVTDKIAQAGVVTGRLREFEMMMKTNKEAYIWDGRGDNVQETAKSTTISEKRNRNAKKADRRY